MIQALADPGRAPMLVMAVGNILRQDDGFADAVLQRLEAMELPETSSCSTPAPAPST